MKEKPTWKNVDDIYLFQQRGIWFISSTLGSMSGYAYSRQGNECPTELEWANHQGEIENLVEIEDNCSTDELSDTTDDGSTGQNENVDDTTEDTTGEQSSESGEIIVDNKISYFMLT